MSKKKSIHSKMRTDSEASVITASGIMGSHFTYIEKSKIDHTKSLLAQTMKEEEEAKSNILLSRATWKGSVGTIQIPKFIIIYFFNFI
jgi:hypothetical protein